MAASLNPYVGYSLGQLLPLRVKMVRISMIVAKVARTSATCPVADRRDIRCPLRQVVRYS